MSGIDGFGAQLKRGDGGAPEVFAAIGNITNISGPDRSRETYDVSAHDSPDAWREFIGGLKDGGEVSLDINYDPAKHDQLADDFDDENPRNYQLVVPVSPPVTLQIKAVMTGFEHELPHDDKASGTITLKVSGKPVLL